VRAIRFSSEWLLLATGLGPQGFHQDFLQQLDEIQTKTMTLARAIPAKRYTWRPAPGVRSVSELRCTGPYVRPSGQAHHPATSQRALCLNRPAGSSPHPQPQIRLRCRRRYGFLACEIRKRLTLIRPVREPYRPLRKMAKPHGASGFGAPGRNCPPLGNRALHGVISRRANYETNVFSAKFGAGLAVM
jgi:hypothetical protein